jgi:hypothetical protein
MASSKRHLNKTSIDAASLFRVGVDDFKNILNVDTPERWGPRYRITSEGVFVPPFDKRDRPEILTVAQRAMLSSPGGEPNKPLLTFPCTLNQLIDWSREELAISLDNKRMVQWMRARVRTWRGNAGWKWLDQIATGLFKVGASDFSALIQDDAEREQTPGLPCSLSKLIAWCYGDDIGKPRAHQPSNNSIVRLIQDRVEGALRDHAGATSAGLDVTLHRARRVSVVSIIKILAAKTRRVAPNSQVQIPTADDIETAEQPQLWDFFRQLLASANIPNGRGAVKAILTAGVFLPDVKTPSAKTIGIVLKEMREKRN